MTHRQNQPSRAALQKPLAVAVFGGLLVSTLFTLIVAPVIYVALERGRKVSSSSQ